MKLSSRNISLFLSLMLVWVSCKDQDSEHPSFSLLIPVGTKILGHKGSGPINDSFNKWFENGKPSVLNALRNLDGTEVDIQMSADSTLWLFHDHTIIDCNDSLINFSLVKDEVIRSISSCNYNHELITLDELNKIISTNQFDQKIISLDLKVLSNPIIRNNWELTELVAFIDQQIDDQLFSDNLLIEIPDDIPTELLQIDRSKSAIYKVHNSSKSLNQSNDNFSIPFHLLDSVDKAESGAEIQTWTPNTALDMINTLDHKPSYIQTDNVRLGRFVKELRNRELIQGRFSKELNVSSQDHEFIPIVSDTLKNIDQLFYGIHWMEHHFNTDQFLVLAITNKKGRVLNYVSHELDKKDYYYFVENSHKEYQDYTFSIYIWNKSKEPLSGSAYLFTYQ